MNCIDPPAYAGWKTASVCPGASMARVARLPAPLPRVWPEARDWSRLSTMPRNSCAVRWTTPSSRAGANGCRNDGDWPGLCESELARDCGCHLVSIVRRSDLRGLYVLTDESLGERIVAVT